MGLVNHANSEVRMQALLAIQKMMVQNWYVNFYPSQITCKPPPPFQQWAWPRLGRGLFSMHLKHMPPSAL